MDKGKIKKKKKLYSDKWDTIRHQVYLRDGFKCVLCGKKTKLHAHHVIPVAISRDNSLNNLVSVCGHCHRKLESVGYKILESGGHKEDVRRTEFKMIVEAQMKIKNRLEKLQQDETIEEESETLNSD